MAGRTEAGTARSLCAESNTSPRYEPPNNEAKVLTGMEGMLWIDKTTFQWVKVEATVIQPVSIAGFLAQVQPGTCFELEKCLSKTTSGFRSILR